MLATFNLAPPAPTYADDFQICISNPDLFPLTVD